MYTSPAPLAQTVLALRQGTLDPREVVAEACDRIERVEPVIRALVEEPGRRQRLLADAERLLERFPDPGERPPLFGALLGVKDIFETAGYVTRAGTTVPSYLWPMPEAPCVTALRDAGALVIGKTVTTEFAFYEPGPTRNPHDPEHTPGGSSSGSAAAVAAGFCHLALGSQTIGSMIRPAAYCGIVGIKPTFGRISTTGVLPFSPSADQIGVFTQDVAGNALAASVVCREWRADRAGESGTEPSGDNAGDSGSAGRSDLARESDRGGQHAGGPGNGPVLGVPDGPYLAQAPAATLLAFAEQVARLETAGYRVRHVPLLADIESVNVRHRRMAAAEMAEEHAIWFAEYGSRYRPRTAEMVRLGQSVGADEVAAARTGRVRLREDIAGAMAESGVDVWLSPPTLGPAPLGIGSTGDPIMNLPWTHAGLPTITVPAGEIAGLPIGLQLSAGWMDDERLLGWANGIAAAVGLE